MKNLSLFSAYLFSFDFKLVFFFFLYVEASAVDTDETEFDDVPRDMSDNDETAMEVDDPPARSSAFVTFNCSTPGCVKQYRLCSNLVKHHNRGDHLFMPDKVNLRDRLILLYKNRAESIKLTQIHQLNNFTVVH